MAKTTVTKMLPSRALRIVRAYAEVLGRTARRILPLPESLLPHDKTAIKEAIRVVVRMTEGDETAAYALEDAYVLLADFVPDDEAAAVSQDREATQPGDAEYEEPERTAPRTMEEIRRQQEALMDEFRSIRRGY